MPNRVILLGAGASADAGIPTAAKLLPVIREHLSQRTLKWLQMEGVFDAVIGALQQQNALRGRPFDPVDVEAMFAAFELLASRASNLLAPFVATWSPGLTEAMRPDANWYVYQVVEMLKNDLAETVGSLASGRPQSVGNFSRFREALRDMVNVTNDRQESVFRDLMGLVRETLCHICWVRSDERVSYLTPLLRSAATTPLWIATLNFDNTIEQASESIGATIDIGISAEGGVQFDDGAPIKLVKLHGSLNWRWSANDIGSIDVMDGPGYLSRIVFGSENKLRVDGPYLDLLLEFRRVLESTDALEVCGYSFRDSHINHTILRWLNRNKSRRLCVIDPHMTLESVLESVSANSGFYLPGARNPTPSPQWFRSVVTVRQAGAKEWAADPVSFSRSP